MLTLQDILADERLHLELVTARTEKALKRRIAGAHAIEVDEAARWVPADWIMLTVGVRLKGHPQRQKELVEALVEGGIAALGVAVDVVFKRAPSTLVETADAAGLPIFTVPLATPFRDIISVVNGSLLNSELFLLRRGFSMQRYLMDALSEDAPEEALVERLASMLQSSVLLLGADGRVEVGRGTAPAAAIWSEITTEPKRVRRFAIGRWSVVSAPVDARDPTGSWLVVGSQTPAVSEQLSKPMIETAQRLLAFIHRARYFAAVENAAMRASLVEAVLERPIEPDGDLATRLAVYGLGHSQPMRVFVVVLGSSDMADAALQDLDGAMRADESAGLIARRGASLIAVAVVGNDERAPERWQTVLAQRDLGVVIGVGRTVTNVGDLHASSRDAWLAAGAAGAHGGPGVVFFHELDVLSTLIGDADERRVRDRVNQFLAPLSEHPRLMQSLDVYFRRRCDVQQAAADLHLHPNSLRYRLQSIEKLLEIDLRDPRDLSSLFIALTARAATAHTQTAEAGAA